MKKYTSMVLAVLLSFNLCISALASEKNDHTVPLENDILFEYLSSGYFVLDEYDNFANPKLVDAYIEFSEKFPEITNISLDMFVSLYQVKGYTSEEQYLNDFIENIIYYNWQEVTDQPEFDKSLTAEQGFVVENEDYEMSAVGDTRSAAGKWYYNTGTSLPQMPTYGSTYNLRTNARTGDILYDAAGGSGFTGHIAVVEGQFYDSTLKELYIRVIEAISEGVTRGVLDDQRFVERRGYLYRVSTATDTKRTNAVLFCRGQLGKPYMIKDNKSSSAENPTWYCSELAWAAYYAKASINLDNNTSILLPVTPAAIRNNSNLSFIVSYT